MFKKYILVSVSEEKYTSYFKEKESYNG